MWKVFTDLNASWVKELVLWMSCLHPGIICETTHLKSVNNAGGSGWISLLINVQPFFVKIFEYCDYVHQLFASECIWWIILPSMYGDRGDFYYMIWTKAKTKHTDLMSEGSDKSQFSICVKIPAETEFLFSEQFNSNKTFLAPFYISLQLTDTQRRDQMPAHRPSNLKYFHFWKKNPDPLMTWIICQVGCLM